jgi:hypothetical protein
MRRNERKRRKGETGLEKESTCEWRTYDENRGKKTKINYIHPEMGYEWKKTRNRENEREKVWMDKELEWRRGGKEGRYEANKDIYIYIYIHIFLSLYSFFTSFFLLPSLSFSIYMFIYASLFPFFYFSFFLSFWDGRRIQKKWMKAYANKQRAGVRKKNDAVWSNSSSRVRLNQFRNCTLSRNLQPVMSGMLLCGLPVFITQRSVVVVLQWFQTGVFRCRSLSIVSKKNILSVSNGTSQFVTTFYNVRAGSILAPFDFWEYFSFRIFIKNAVFNRIWFKMTGLNFALFITKE